MLTLISWSRWPIHNPAFGCGPVAAHCSIVRTGRRLGIMILEEWQQSAELNAYSQRWKLPAVLAPATRASSKKLYNHSIPCLTRCGRFVQWKNDIGLHEASKSILCRIEFVFENKIVDSPCQHTAAVRIGAFCVLRPKPLGLKMLLIFSY